MSDINKNILVLGAKGMLGHDVVAALKDDFDVAALDIEEVDVTNLESVRKVLQKESPKVVINCTVACANADRAEKEKELAFKVNAEGVRNLAKVCKELEAKLVHYSSDYVFNGKKDQPYDEADHPDPLSVYGKSKLQGEDHLKKILDDYIIIRTSWLFGEHGRNFVKTILKLASEKDELKIVNDQIGSPTYTKDLANATKKLIDLDAKGTFHIAATDCCSWFEFAKEILETVGIRAVEVEPIASDELNLPARRPKNSRFNCEKFEKLTNHKMPKWRDSLKIYMESDSLSKVV